MTGKRNSSCLRVVAFLMAISLCLGVIAFLLLLDWIPTRAEATFGPAGSQVRTLERVFYAVRMLLQKDDLLLPVQPNGKAQTFRIQAGDSVNLIALHLEEAGLIRSAEAFRLYLIYSGADTELQVGDFSLSPAKNAIQIANTLRDANAREINFRILAGWRVEEVAAALAASGMQIKTEDFLKLAAQPSGLLPEGLAGINNLEGFLYPDVYALQRTTTAAEFIAKASAKFDAQVTPELRLAFQKQGLSLAQAVTLASIVQREAMVAEEQPVIASVFYNRLKKGMKLDSDPTVQYAVGYNAAQKTWWTNPLSLANLKIDSPYNTYTKIGLPPGPIASPGIAALRAVAFPAQTPYYYFRAKCDQSGQHAFSVTYEEHLKNACP